MGFIASCITYPAKKIVNESTTSAEKIANKSPNFKNKWRIRKIYEKKIFKKTWESIFCFVSHPPRKKPKITTDRQTDIILLCIIGNNICYHIMPLDSSQSFIHLILLLKYSKLKIIAGKRLTFLYQH